MAAEVKEDRPTKAHSHEAEPTTKQRPPRPNVQHHPQARAPVELPSRPREDSQRASLAKRLLGSTRSRTSDPRFGKLCAQGLSGSQSVLSTPDSVANRVLLVLREATREATPVGVSYALRLSDVGGTSHCIRGSTGYVAVPSARPSTTLPGRPSGEALSTPCAYPAGAGDRACGLAGGPPRYPVAPNDSVWIRSGAIPRASRPSCTSAMNRVGPHM